MQLACDVEVHSDDLQQFRLHIMEPFIVQLIHTWSLLKQIKIKKAAPTCFGLQGNHHQVSSQCLGKITHLVHADT